MSCEAQLITAGDIPGKGISILSLDGGGPGTLSQMLLLKDIFRRLEYDLNVDEDTLRPADHFDLMGGVGFGGLSALMLGYLRMGLEKTMEELATIGAIIFPHSPSETTTPEGKTARLRGAIEGMLQRNGLPIDIKLKDKALRGSTCKVVIFAATLETRFHCHPLRTYASRYGATDCSFVDAACATLVLPELFSPISIGPSWARQKFVGTPFGYNNPMRQVLQEARLNFGDEKQVALLLSLGSGRPNEMNLDSQHPDRHINFLTHVAYDCERVARELSDQLSGVGAYKRLNVNRGVENIQMFDWHELGTISSHTAAYLQSSAIIDEVDFCSGALQNRTAAITLGQLNRTGVAILAKFNPHQYGNHLALSPMAIKQIGDIVRGGVKGITLVDAIGNFIPISMELCRTYSTPTAPGRELVERGDYRLVYGDSRSRVEPTRWTYTVNAGLTVEMSMVLRKRSSTGTSTTCPRCNETYDGDIKDGWVDWKVLRILMHGRAYGVHSSNVSCLGQFQLEDERAERLEEVEDLISPAISSQDRRSGGAQRQGTRSQSLSSVQAPQLTEEERKKMAENEQRQYRLISVINLLDAFPNAVDRGTSVPEYMRAYDEGNMGGETNSVYNEGESGEPGRPRSKGSRTVVPPGSKQLRNKRPGNSAVPVSPTPRRSRSRSPTQIVTEPGNATDYDGRIRSRSRSPTQMVTQGSGRSPKRRRVLKPSRSRSTSPVIFQMDFRSHKNPNAPLPTQLGSRRHRDHTRQQVIIGGGGGEGSAGPSKRHRTQGGTPADLSGFPLPPVFANTASMSPPERLVNAEGGHVRGAGAHNNESVSHLSSATLPYPTAADETLTTGYHRPRPGVDALTSAFPDLNSGASQYIPSDINWLLSSANSSLPRSVVPAPDPDQFDRDLEQALASLGPGQLDYINNTAVTPAPDQDQFERDIQQALAGFEPSQIAYLNRLNTLGFSQQQFSHGGAPTSLSHPGPLSAITASSESAYGDDRSESHYNPHSPRGSLVNAANPSHFNAAIYQALENFSADLAAFGQPETTQATVQPSQTTPRPFTNPIQPPSVNFDQYVPSSTASGHFFPTFGDSGNSIRDDAHNGHGNSDHSEREFSTSTRTLGNHQQLSPQPHFLPLNLSD